MDWGDIQSMITPYYMWCIRRLGKGAPNKFGILRKTSIDLYVFVTICALPRVYLLVDLVRSVFNLIEATTDEDKVSLWRQKKIVILRLHTCGSQKAYHKIPTPSMLVLV